MIDGGLVVVDLAFIWYVLMLAFGDVACVEERYSLSSICGVVAYALSG